MFDCPLGFMADMLHCLRDGLLRCRPGLYKGQPEVGSDFTKKMGRILDALRIGLND